MSKDIKKLFEAVLFREPETLKKLIKAGVDVNAVYSSKFQYTPLNVAIQRKYPDIVEILIPHADLSQSLRYEVKRFYRSTNKQLCQENIQFLLENGAVINISNVWITEDDLPIDVNLASIFLNAGADVNRIEHYTHFTLLHRASLCPRSDIRLFWLFLQRGACVNICERMGYNALNFYLKYHCPPRKEIAMLLFAAGNDLQGTTIFISAYLPLVKVPEYLFPDNDTKISLKNSCRNVIRRHLLCISDINLFLKVPKLPLPLMTRKYLLYGQELYDNKISDFIREEAQETYNHYNVTAHFDIWSVLACDWE